MSKYVSPKGTAGYPKLTRPDTKFKAEGEYSTSLTMDKKTAQPLIDLIEEAYVEEFGQKAVPKANYPFKEDDEGNVTFKFKSKNKPKLFDANGKPVFPPTEEEIEDGADPLNIGSGSVLKVSGAISCRAVSGKNYATLYMNQVQIIDLVEYVGGGFQAEEGSFEAPPRAAKKPASKEAQAVDNTDTDEEVDF